ncbi:STAS-like domain-containing protein [Roseivirga sp. BDSF3-8]|uniref:STAS-like domain-containing protein n=1 Tax=Roseivirga sp. BDSF3-8 TaxID=3241598 RepID=UPI0035319EDE
MIFSITDIIDSHIGIDTKLGSKVADQVLSFHAGNPAEPIELDFTGLDRFSSLFIHASVGKVARELKQRIAYTGVSSDVKKRKINDAIELAIDDEKARNRQRYMEEAMNA